MSNYYYHFATVGEDGIPRLSYGDGRGIRVGETLTVEGVPELCEHGLHASARILDALRYAGGGSLALCRVTLGGTVIHDDDKSVATERTVIAMLPVAETDALLRAFARRCALSVAHLWEMPDVVRRYLETGDESVRDAAWAAAWAAVRDAAWDAAWDAASAAVRDAAWDAASAAAWAAVRDAQNAQLEHMASEAMQIQGDWE